MATITVLGIAQDGGRPQPGCQRPCCKDLSQSDYRSPVSLGIKTENGTTILIEATRDLGRQLLTFGEPSIDHLFLTHAHLGHVDGLGLFGRETMSARGILLHSSSSMQNLIKSTPAWAILLEQGVFTLTEIGRVEIDDVVIESIAVPHRAELSDMHAFVIRGKDHSVLFLPDHDSWVQTLSTHNASSIREWLNNLAITHALLDGTFWSGDELQGRDMSVVPHPTIQDSLMRLGEKKIEDPEIYFTHLNHTNPAFQENSSEYQKITQLGWKVSSEGQRINL
ncbi:MAG: MBL fold metallo-hydrolase [Candidatus Poseidoniaceae archaeon]|nr:MBL fold metallo-hydrolase [Candidatus Poseidoniaceae archaeon]